MENKNLTAPATINKIETLSDRTIRLKVDLDKEISAQEKAMLFEFDKKSGWFLFAENPMDNIDIPKTPVKTSKGETPSQVLRKEIWKQWNHSSQEIDEEEYYIQKMRKIVGMVMEDKI